MTVIQDVAGNPLITQSSPMIGFVPVPPPGEAVSLEMYLFLIEVIRQEDQQNGDRFVERFLEGPQAIWEQTSAAISRIPQLWDVANIPDRLLVFLKQIVGWTPDLNNITDPLDALTLRRLIAASVPFWKRRGPKDATEDILRLVAGARLRTWNWFDYRVILDETAFGEDWNGFDPWMVSLPGPPNVDEYRSNVRIVDDGTLNRAVVRDLVKLSRPAGERVEISYIGFLDLFTVDGDDSQWSDEADPFAGGGSASQSAVSAGTLVVTPTTPGDSAEAYVDLPGATSWTNYTSTCRIRGASPRCTFYRTSNGDMYYIESNVASNVLKLHKIVAGVDSAIAADVDMAATLGVNLKSDLYYAIRVFATPEAGQTRVKIFWESTLLFNVLDPDHAQGSIGTGHAAAGASELDEAELFFNPLETDTIDINP